MKFTRPPIEDVSVNLTPLIDVVFLLLIFFMVSTTFTKENRLTLELPKGSGDVAVQRAETIEITVDEKGSYAVNGRSLVNRKLKTVMAAINKISDGDISKPLVVTADARAPHQSVVTVMDAAGQLGFTNLSITTVRPNG